MIDMKTYIESEKEEMLRYKWIESEKAGRDLGEAALMDWIEKHAASFQKKFFVKKERDFLN